MKSCEVYIHICMFIYIYIFIYTYIYLYTYIYIYSISSISMYMQFMQLMWSTLMHQQPSSKNHFLVF